MALTLLNHTCRIQKDEQNQPEHSANLTRTLKYWIRYTCKISFKQTLLD